MLHPPLRSETMTRRTGDGESRVLPLSPTIPNCALHAARGGSNCSPNPLARCRRAATPLTWRARSDVSVQQPTRWHRRHASSRHKPCSMPRYHGRWLDRLQMVRREPCIAVPSMPQASPVRCMQHAAIALPEMHGACSRRTAETDAAPRHLPFALRFRV